MTPALWTELISATVTLFVAGAAYLRANTAHNSANTAITALKAHSAVAHNVPQLWNRTEINQGVAVSEINPAMTEQSAPELTDPVGLQGASLMGFSGQTIPAEPETVPETLPEAAPTPVPVAESVPQVSAVDLLDRVAEALQALRNAL
jgi:hypothetical protein